MKEDFVKSSFLKELSNFSARGLAKLDGDLSFNRKGCLSCRRPIFFVPPQEVNQEYPYIGPIPAGCVSLVRKCER